MKSNFLFIITLFIFACDISKTKKMQNSNNDLKDIKEEKVLEKENSNKLILSKSFISSKGHCVNFKKDYKKNLRANVFDGSFGHKIGNFKVIKNTKLDLLKFMKLPELSQKLKINLLHDKKQKIVYLGDLGLLGGGNGQSGGGDIGGDDNDNADNNSNDDHGLESFANGGGIGGLGGMMGGDGGFG